MLVVPWKYGELDWAWALGGPMVYNAWAALADWIGYRLGGVESILTQSHIGRTAGAEEDRGQRGPGAFCATVALVG